MTADEHCLSTEIAKRDIHSEAKKQELREFRDRWASAMLASDAKPATIRVAWLLVLRYLNTDPAHPWFGCAWPSKQTVAQQTHLSLESAKRAFRELQGAGFLVAIDQRPNHGFQNSGTVVYALKLPGVIRDPGVTGDRGSCVTYPGVTGEPPRGSYVTPNSINNSLNYSKNFPLDGHLSTPHKEGAKRDHMEWADDREMESLSDFLQDEHTIYNELLPYWVTIAMKYDTELTFCAAFEAVIDAATECAGLDARRQSWASAFMAMMKAIATGETGEDGEVYDLAVAVENADTTRREHADRLRRGERTWRWFKAAMPDSQQRREASDEEWRVVWEQLIFEGYQVADLEDWCNDNRDQLRGKYPREVASMVWFEPGIAYREQFSA